MSESEKETKRLSDSYINREIDDDDNDNNNNNNKSYYRTCSACFVCGGADRRSTTAKDWSWWRTLPSCSKIKIVQMDICLCIGQLVNLYNSIVVEKNIFIPLLRNSFSNSSSFFSNSITLWVPEGASRITNKSDRDRDRNRHE